MHDLRALVVDDSKVGRLTMLRKLEPMGMRVDLAESGQQCLDYLATQRPDLIFMDHMMPDLDGFEVTRRIKASPTLQDIPVIIVSGNDEPAFVQEAREAGALDAITKPPATEALVRLMAALPAPTARPEVPATPLPPAVAAEVRPALTLEDVHALLAKLRLEIRADLETRLDAQDAALEAFRRQAADSESLGHRLDLLAKRVQAVETVADRPMPDVEGLRRDLEHRIEAERARLADRAETWGPALESLRHELLERVDKHAASRDSEVDALRQRLEGLAAELRRLEGEQRAASGELAARVAPLESPSTLDLQVAEAVGDEQVSESPVYLRLQSELQALDERLGESRIRQLVANAMADRTLPAEAPYNDAPLQAQLASLRSGLRRLRTLALLGGGLLLGVVGLVLFLG